MVGAGDYIDTSPKETPLKDLIAKAKAKYDPPKPTQHEQNLAGMRQFLRVKALQTHAPRKPATGRAPLPSARLKWWKSRRADRFRTGTEVKE
jgi:hypothetical protein